MNYLHRAAERGRREVERRAPNEASLLVRAHALPSPMDLIRVLRAGPALVAEIRRTSPYPGAIGPAGRWVGDVAAQFERAGAAALSVVTEPLVFDGSASDVRVVRRRTGLPLIRRDVPVHPAQVAEARVEGADAVVLVVAVLTPAALADLGEAAGALGMAAVAEVHDREDLGKAVDSPCPVVLVSGRNPDTLGVEWDPALALVRDAPPDRTIIAEGGIRDRQAVVEAQAAGAHAVLVGSALLRTARVEEVVDDLLGGAGRGT